MVQHAGMNSPDTQFKLRLPAELKAKLEGQAATAGRSLSAEIVHRIEQGFEGNDMLLQQIQMTKEAMSLAEQWRQVAEGLQAELKRRTEEMEENRESLAALNSTVSTLTKSVDRLLKK